MSSVARGLDSRSKRLARECSPRTLGVLMVLPSLGMIALVLLAPLVGALWLSLQQWHLAEPHQGRSFVGLSNYAQALSSGEIWRAFGRTGYFTVVSVSLELVFGLCGAVLLNEVFRGRGLFRAMLLAPWALLTITNGLIWRWMLNADHGLVNGVLARLGMGDEPILWLGRPALAMHMVILADVWKMTPFMTLLLLAGLQPIPDSHYEAAEMDGAGGWRKLWHVVLPQLRPAILVAVVLRTMGAFKVFDIVYVLTGGGPADSTNVIAMRTYREAFRYFHVGYGAALSWLMTVAIMLLVVIYIRLIGFKVDT